MSDHQAMPASGMPLPIRSRWVLLAQLRMPSRSISSSQPAAFGGVTGEQETVMVFTSSGWVAASIMTGMNAALAAHQVHRLAVGEVFDDGNDVADDDFGGERKVFC